jgi:hypothetical protein
MLQPNRFPRQLKTIKSVRKGAAKTSETADATARQARSKVKKAVAKTRIEAKKITRKGKRQ